MLTKAENAVKVIVKSFYDDMQDPNLRGENFNPITFNIERWVDSHLHLYYKTGNVKPEARERALISARKLWNHLNHIR
jgi:hypothetical protein